MRKSAALRRAGACLLGLGLFLCALKTVPEGIYDEGQDNHKEFIRGGELLLHGLEDGTTGVNSYLPMSSLSAALLFNHAPYGSERLWRLLSCAAGFLLILALGALTGTAPQALAAFAILLLLQAFPDGKAYFYDLAQGSFGYFTHRQTWHSFTYFEEGFSLLVWLAAGALVWRSRAPTPERTFVLALAIGTSFLYRSTLVFLPPLLLLADWRAGRASRKSAALLLSPYLFLVPWTLMNWVTDHRFIPLENGEADPLVIGGALGLLHRMRAEGQALAGVSGSVFAWAAAEVSRHPLRFGAAFLRRLYEVFRLHPALFLLAAPGFFLSRRRPEARALAFFAAYFVIIHCLMTVNHNYFDPLWAMLAVLAALLLPGGKTDLKKPAEAVMGTGLALALLLALFTQYRVAAYAAGFGRGAAPEQAAARNPEDPWLLAERGRSRLLQGDVAGAVEDLSLSARLRPGHWDRDAVLVWARLLGGDAEPFLRWDRPPTVGDNFFTSVAAFLRAHGYVKLGMKDEARREMRLSLSFSHGAADPGLACGFVSTQTRRWLSKRPLSESLPVLDGYGALLPACGGFAVERSELAYAAGERLKKSDPMAALKLLKASGDAQALRRWERELEDSGDYRGAMTVAEALPGPLPGRAVLAWRAGRRDVALKNALSDGPKSLLQFAAATDPAAALEILTALAARFPAAVEIQRELADAALRAGDKGLFLDSLERAQRLRPDRAGLARVIEACLAAKDFARALKASRALTGLVPGEAGLWLSQYELASKAGDAELSLAALARAAKLRPGEQALHRIALIYQERGRCGQALELLDRLPRRADVLSDKGVCEKLLGSPEKAVVSLRAALALDPAWLPAALTLGALYAEQGREAEAARVYEAALKSSAAKSGDPLYALAQESLARLKKAP